MDKIANMESKEETSDEEVELVNAAEENTENGYISPVIVSFRGNIKYMLLYFL
jgi:hypothetical protein